MGRLKEAKSMLQIVKGRDSVEALGVLLESVSVELVFDRKQVMHVLMNRFYKGSVFLIKFYWRFRFNSPPPCSEASWDWWMMDYESFEIWVRWSEYGKSFVTKVIGLTKTWLRPLSIAWIMTKSFRYSPVHMPPGVARPFREEILVSSSFKSRISWQAIWIMMALSRHFHFWIWV